MISLETPLRLVPFVSVDVETTGLDPQNDHIVEVGAVKVRDGEIVEELSSLVSIDRTIPFEARRVHGITNEMLVGQPRIDLVLADLLEFAADGALVEHSFRAFDVAFLERAHGTRFDAPYLNTCTLSRRLFPFHRRHSLEECCRRHGIVNEGPHRALTDARATAKLLIYLLSVCSVRYPRLSDLAAAASVER